MFLERLRIQDWIKGVLVASVVMAIVRQLLAVSRTGAGRDGAEALLVGTGTLVALLCVSRIRRLGFRLRHWIHSRFKIPSRWVRTTAWLAGALLNLVLALLVVGTVLTVCEVASMACFRY